MPFVVGEQRGAYRIRRAVGPGRHEHWSTRPTMRPWTGTWRSRCSTPMFKGDRGFLEPLSRREARIVARLVSIPNIVPVYDFSDTKVSLPGDALMPRGAVP